MTAIGSTGAVYDPLVQVFGTVFVSIIGLAFVVRIALLFLEHWRERDPKWIALREQLVRMDTDAHA